MPAERVQKILAQAGIASRRKAEELIVEGLVTINGRVAKLGDKAEWGKDAIKVKGKLLLSTENPVYLAFHKPRGVICSLYDPEGRPTLASFLDKVKERVYPIGRLDFNSEGLILLTNDGAFAEKVQKEGSAPRVYSVKVKGYPDDAMMERLRRGARFGHLKKKAVIPLSVRITEKLQSKAVIEVVMVGSGAFDIKSLFETKGFLVEKVVRLGIGQITLKSLAPGHFRYLKSSQVQALLEQPELGLRRLQHEQEQAPEPRAPKREREKKPVIRPNITPVIRPVRPGSKKR